MKRRMILLTGAVAVAMLLLLGSAVAQQAGSLKFTPGMTVQSLDGRPGSDRVQLPSGRQVTVTTMRRLDALQKALRASKMAQPRLAQLGRPAATGLPIGNESGLVAALANRADNETLQLPSGRVITAGQLRLLQPYIERRLGRKLGGAGQEPIGPVYRQITRNSADKALWQEILNQPPDKVLQSPSGIKITVGELRQFLALTPGAGRGVVPRTVLPTKVPPPAQKGVPK